VLNLDRRVAALEKGMQMDADGRDPGVIELVELACKAEGWVFNREMVPPGYTVRHLLADAQRNPRNRLTHLPGDVDQRQACH
jgi:hypothetical protein